MKWTEIPSGQTNGAIQRLMVSLGEQAEVAVTRINTEPTFVERLAEYAINGCIVPNASHDGAREIMGKNFFGIPEAMKHFGVNPTRRQLAILSEIPFTPEELMMCNDTHILVAVFSLSICDLRSKVANNTKTLFCKLCKQDWYDNKAFANDKREISWQLILKTPVTNSTNKNWEEQNSLITRDEEVLTAQAVVYTTIGHYLNTDERLFGGVCVRTSSIDPDGNHVYVSYLDEGLYIDSEWDGRRSSNLGLSVARK